MQGKCGESGGMGWCRESVEGVVGRVRAGTLPCKGHLMRGCRTLASACNKILW